MKKQESEGAYEVEWVEDGIIGGREIGGEHRTIYLFRRFRRMSDSHKETLIEKFEGYYDNNGIIIRL